MGCSRNLVCSNADPTLPNSRNRPIKSPNPRLHLRRKFESPGCPETAPNDQTTALQRQFLAPDHPGKTALLYKSTETTNSCITKHCAYLLESNGKVFLHEKHGVWIGNAVVLILGITDRDSKPQYIIGNLRRSIENIVPIVGHSCT